MARVHNVICPAIVSSDIEHVISQKDIFLHVDFYLLIKSNKICLNL